MPATRTDDRPRCSVCGQTGRPYQNRVLYTRDDYVYCTSHLIQRLVAEGVAQPIEETLP